MLPIAFMNAVPIHLAATLTTPELPSFLTVGSDAGSGVTLSASGLYTWGFLIGGPLLILVAVVMVRTMYVRVKFFALEYGEGTSWGRTKEIVPWIALGAGLILIGGGSLFLGWQNFGHSATLTSAGLTEVWHGKIIRYSWSDADSASEHIKANEFMLSFAKDGHKCRVYFVQNQIGEKLQDKAIAITENALIAVKVPRQPSKTDAISEL